jgi:hypothetical protein
MNAKLAKFLRKQAKGIAQAGIEPYTTQRFEARLVPTGRLNEDGTQQQRVFIPITVRNAQYTARGVYRALKKTYK